MQITVLLYLWQQVTASRVIQKDGRATDSCFSFIETHQCGVLMVIDGRLENHWILPYIT